MNATLTSRVAEYVRLDRQYGAIVDEVLVEADLAAGDILEDVAVAVRDAAAERLLGGLLLARPDFALIEAERGIDYSGAAACVRLMVKDALEGVEWTEVAEALLAVGVAR
ncbi:MAG: hypothetical protein ACRDL8_21755 [Solirubrobacteraceae bacterium]